MNEYKQFSFLETDVIDDFTTFSTEDCIVWVDPLDGTLNFVEGKYHAVTVLIGVSIKGHAKIGIIHSPFSKSDPSKGETYFGTLEHGVFRVDVDFSKPEVEDAEREIL